MLQSVHVGAIATRLIPNNVQYHPWVIATCIAQAYG